MGEVRGEKRDERSGVSTLDAIGLGLATVCVAILWGLQLFVVRPMLALFEDFGTTEPELPLLTRFVETPLTVALVTLGVLVASGVGVVLRLRGHRALGGVALGGAVVVALVAIPLMLVAAYQPFFTTAIVR